jgi:hypothetical protein
MDAARIFPRQFWDVVLRHVLWVSGSLLLLLSLTSCAIQQVSAEERLFLPLQLTFLQELILPPQDVNGYRFGGISAIAYDRQADVLYALSDARKRPCLFRLRLQPSKTPEQPVKGVSIDGVIPLLTQAGDPYPDNQLDPEGLALAPDGNLILSSEGVAETGAPPQVLIFNRQGQLQKAIPVPQRFIPDGQGKRGVLPNNGFESLTLVPAAPGEPLRVFVAPETPLAQDRSLRTLGEGQGDPPQGDRLRVLHYLLGQNTAQVVSEQMYSLAQASLPNHGLTELLSIDQGGHFLALERSFGPKPAGGTQWQAKLFQITLATATDTSGYDSLAGTLSPEIRAIPKQKLINFDQLPIQVDNLEGLTFGPRLGGQNPTLLMISDDNFEPRQKTQLLIFRIQTKSLTSRSS